MVTDITPADVLVGEATEPFASEGDSGSLVFVWEDEKYFLIGSLHKYRESMDCKTFFVHHVDYIT